MGKFAAIGAALLGGGAAATAAGTIGTTLIGGLAVASAGVGIAGGVSSLIGSGGEVSTGALPSVPTTQQAQAAAQQQISEQRRRGSKRVFTSIEEQANLLSTPSTTPINLLGQGRTQ